MDSKNVEKIRNSFPAGTRIELIRMGSDPKGVPDGTKGTVAYVDDIGTIHMKWETGSSLGLILGEDLFKVIEEVNNGTPGGCPPSGSETVPLPENALGGMK